MNTHSQKVGSGTKNSRRTASVRRQREKERHREEILDAAERVFVARGFEQATMEGIAREAGFSTGALYNFFQSKEELCLQVLRKQAEEFISVFNSDILRCKDPADAINHVVELRVRHIRVHGPFLRMLHEHPTSSQLNHAAFREACGGLIEAYLRDLASLFERAMNAGRVRKMDPTYAALALEGILLVFSMHWDRTGTAATGSIEQKVATVKKNYLNHIMINPGAGRS